MMDDLFVELDKDLKGGEPELALDKCQVFVQESPHSAVVHSQLARILLHLGRWEDAEAASQMAIALDPELALPYAFLGYIQLQREQPREAEWNLAKAVELDPQDSLSHYYLGLAYLSSNRSANAAEQFEQAIAINSQEAAFHVRLATAYLDLNHLRAALSEVVAAFRLDRRSEGLFQLVGLFPLAVVAQGHPTVRIVALLLLHVPLLAPDVVSIPYCVVVGAYWVWLTLITLRMMNTQNRILLFGFLAWWMLVPWLLRLLEWLFRLWLI
ncbi:MAG: tetratricopeptide repeat protein [Anaerolineae bacterium]